MKKKLIAAILIGTLTTGILPGCGNSSQQNTEVAVQSEETAEEEDATLYYEEGRACLYGLDGKKIELEAAHTNFEKALELGKTEANFYMGVLYYCFNYPEKDDQKANTYFEAAGDNPYAQILLAEQYYWGKGVEEDKAKGQELIDAVIAQGYAEGYAVSGDMAYEEEDYTTVLECYNKASESNEPLFAAMAMSNIGDMYWSGSGVEQDYAAAMEWYKKAADLGNSIAMYDVGYLYDYGQGVEQDYAAAKEWYEKAADLGDSDAMYRIGRLYDYGNGVEQDYAAAKEWYEKAADLEHSKAMLSIGYLYDYGQGVEQDYAAAMEWYKKAADLGNSTAMYNIGYMHDYGQGVEQDYAAAMEWYEKAADLGYSDAMYCIGHLYYYGNGVEQDYAAAKEWYEKAADLGDSDAMSYIGVMYVIGNGVEEDYAAAMEWFIKAADLGNNDAMEAIGFLYEEGLGVEKDLVKAQEWYEKAGVPEKAEAAKKEAASGDGSSNDTGFIPQTYVGPNGTFVANTEEEMWDAAAKAMGAEIVTIEGDGETGGGSLAGLGVGVEVNSQ